jgi:Ca2+-binding EF-hand superfamily protein
MGMQSALVKMFMMNDLRHGDSNGQMDLEEFEELCHDVLKLNFTEAQAREVFRYLDIDRSGQISVEELVDELMCLEAPSPIQPRKDVSPPRVYPFHAYLSLWHFFR